MDLPPSSPLLTFIDLEQSGIVAIAFPGTAARASAEYASWAERQADYEGLPSWHPETFLGHSPM